MNIFSYIQSDLKHHNKKYRKAQRISKWFYQVEW